MKTAVLQDVGFRQGLPSAFGPTYEVFMMKKFSGLLAAVVCMLLPAACSPAGTDGSAPGSAVSGSSSVVTRPPSSPEVSSPESSVSPRDAAVRRGDAARHGGSSAHPCAHLSSTYHHAAHHPGAKAHHAAHRRHGERHHPGGFHPAADRRAAGGEGRVFQGRFPGDGSNL